MLAPHLQHAQVTEVGAAGHGAFQGRRQDLDVAEAQVDTLAGQRMHRVRGVADERHPRPHIPSQQHEVLGLDLPFDGVRRRTAHAMELKYAHASHPRRSDERAVS